MANEQRENVTLKWLQIAVPALLFVIAHTGVLVWTIGSLSQKVANQTEQIVELKLAIKAAADDRYRGADARRDLDRIDAVHREFMARLQAIEAKMKP